MGSGYTSYEVQPSSLVFGLNTTINLLDGQVEITIPKGCQSGTKLRLKGKGLYLHPQKNYRGDVFIQIQACTPQNLSEEEIKIYQELAKVEKTPVLPKKGIVDKLKNFFK